MLPCMPALRKDSYTPVANQSNCVFRHSEVNTVCRFALPCLTASAVSIKT